LLIGGAVGIVTTAGDIYQNWTAGNYNMLAFDFGQLFGGFLVGAGGGGRSLANGIMGGESECPNTWNILAILGKELELKYNGSLGSPGEFMGTGPTPFMAGTTAAGTGAGPVTIVSVGIGIYQWFFGDH
jgi:hypothetical protein